MIIKKCACLSKKEKKIFLLPAFAAIFTLSFFAVAATAHAATATLGAGTVSGNPGAEVIVPINLTASASSVTSVSSFDLTYDASKLTFTSVVLGSAMGSAVATPISGESTPPGVVSVALVEMNATPAGNLPNGQILQVKFNIKSTAAAGSSAISLSNAATLDKNSVSMATTTANGAVTIGSTTYALADFIALIPRWLTDVSAGNSSDLNGDLKVNSKDLGIMMSKWRP